MFRQADTEETGAIEASLVPSLAAKALGSVKDSEMHLIRYRAEAKAGMSYPPHTRYELCVFLVLSYAIYVCL